MAKLRARGCTEPSGRASARIQGGGWGWGVRGGAGEAVCPCLLLEDEAGAAWLPPPREPDPRCRAESPSGSLPNASLSSARGTAQDVTATRDLLVGSLSTIQPLPRSCVSYLLPALPEHSCQVDVRRYWQVRTTRRLPRNHCAAWKVAIGDTQHPSDSLCERRVVLSWG